MPPRWTIAAPTTPTTTSDLKAQQGIFYPEDFGAKGDGTTDDTVAIQAAIDAACNLRGGTVQFGPKTYLVNGAPRTDRGGNQILGFPVYPIDASQGYHTVTLKGTGMAAPQSPVGTVIKTTRTTDTNAAFGIPCVIGGPSAERASAWNLLNVHIEDLTIELPNNPKLSGIDLVLVVRASIERVCVVTVSPTTVNPTTVYQFGLRMPDRVNYGYARIGAYFAYGVYTALVANTEHTTAEYLSSKFNYLTLGLTGNGGAHASNFGKIQSEWVKFHVAGWGAGYGAGDIVGGGKVVLNIDCLDIEDRPAGDGWAPIAHIQDGQNLLHGRIQYARHVIGTGQVFTNGITVNGGTGVTLVDLAA